MPNHNDTKLKESACLSALKTSYGICDTNNVICWIFIAFDWLVPCSIVANSMCVVFQYIWISILFTNLDLFISISIIVHTNSNVQNVIGISTQYQCYHRFTCNLFFVIPRICCSVDNVAWIFCSYLFYQFHQNQVQCTKLDSLSTF